jgi:mono/diheme cytochrome c family protein
VPPRIRSLAILTALPLLAATLRAAPSQERSVAAPPDAAPSGADVYRAACQTCHGTDGRGNPKSHVGFDVALPDFTDCAFATPEAEADWFAIVSNGGPVRGFDRHMPSFRDALSEEEIHRVVGHLRGFCADRRWPRGDLNLPRALVTEKAFPENETLVTTAVSRFGGAAVGTNIVYEHRIGARAQWEMSVPIELQRTDAGGWGRGLGDVAVAIKHALFHDVDRGSILSVGTEVLLPTGKEAAGFGKGVIIFEPFVSIGQILPSNAFVQAQAGIELPRDRRKSAREVFWRVAAGQTFFHQRFNREWSPMLEAVAAKELSKGEHTLWDVVPQLQVSLSRRHHVLINGGFQLPVNDRADRGRTFRMYLLWDWFDGGLFSGW